MPPLPNLSSAKAALIRDLLRHKRTREVERAFVLEGAKPILELLRSKSPALLAVVATSTFLEKNRQAFGHALDQTRAAVYTCRDTTFEKLSDVSTSQGILAIVRQPEWDQEAILRRPRVFGIYGECLQDPANVGGIIRTALAFQADALWLSLDSADVFNPKVVRATAGALLMLPVFPLTDLGLFARHHCALVAAEPPRKGGRRIRAITSLPSRTILALGNESRGLSEATLKQAAFRFHIPVNPAINSLNVAASAAIALFYFSGLSDSGKG
ncbi:MAG: TrmH family RNA methyltransferase [Nitrospiraceae bacterium]